MIITSCRQENVKQIEDCWREKGNGHAGEDGCGGVYKKSLENLTFEINFQLDERTAEGSEWLLLVKQAGGSPIPASEVPPPQQRALFWTQQVVDDPPR